jgi:hypothetical protein
MAFVSVTRLRVRSLRFMPGFFLHAAGSTSQIRHADGFIVGSLLRDRQLTFWTMTVWHGQADMRRYITNGAHFKAMPKLMDWCDEASVVHWEQPEEALAGWEDADQRMRVEGRPSKVRHPSAHHPDLTYRLPRTSKVAPIMRAT